MAQFIDRRLNGKNKSAVNRQRFLRRHKEQIKESVADAVNRRSITNTETGEDVTIPHKDIKEPSFHQGQGGVRERVHQVMISSSRVTRSNVLKVVGKVAVQVKVMQALMAKAKTNLLSKYQRMST